MITQSMAIARSRPDGDIRNGDPKSESASYLIGILQSKKIKGGRHKPAPLNKRKRGLKQSDEPPC